ncbi:MAG: hypothetical protein U0235_27385 [Polyangiaceae bacterium]
MSSTTRTRFGPDRRRHRVYVTKNTEYHFRDGFCVAVRGDRRPGDSARPPRAPPALSTAASSST